MDKVAEAAAIEPVKYYVSHPTLTVVPLPLFSLGRQ